MTQINLKVTEAEKREISLTREQAEKLLDNLPESLANIAEFAIYTGFRKENILSMRIESIRFHDDNPTGEVMLKKVKGGKAGLYYLAPVAVELLKRVIGDRKEGFIFLNPRTKTRYVSIHKTYDRVVRKLGLTADDDTKLRIHDLRHVFGSWLHEKEVSLDALRHLMGHNKMSTTDRYITVNKMATVKNLSRMPSIRTSGHKKALTGEESGHLLAQSDTNFTLSN